MLVSDCHYLLYYQYSVQLFEAAFGHHIYHSRVVYRVFLTFYWFKLNFDQGGFAFVRFAMWYYGERQYLYPQRIQCHPEASSTNVGFESLYQSLECKDPSYLPDGGFHHPGFYSLYVGTDKEAFWFPLAAGTIGGLVMSIIGIFFFLPVFVLKKSW